jgi:probable rRNA maturation factor
MPPRVNIAISFKHPDRHRVPNAARLIRRATRAALRAADKLPPGAVEISIVVADNDFIRTLNHEHRGLDRPTNVLAFADARAAGPSTASGGGEGPPLVLGDIVLGLDTLTAEAAAQHKTVADHICHLVVHGVLHLLGLGHGSTAAARMMETVERRALARLGIADPYQQRSEDHGALPSRPRRAKAALGDAAPD